MQRTYRSRKKQKEQCQANPPRPTVFTHNPYWQVSNDEVPDDEGEWQVVSSSVPFQPPERETPEKQPVVRRCEECCREGVITGDTIQWYLRRQLQVPKRCQQCRDQRKNRQKLRQPNPAAPVIIRGFPHEEAKTWSSTWNASQTTPPKSAQPETPAPRRTSSSKTSTTAISPSRYRNSSPIKGKFWDVQSSSNESDDDELPQKAHTTYWYAPANSCIQYDSALQQEQFMDPPHYPPVSNEGLDPFPAWNLPDMIQRDDGPEPPVQVNEGLSPQDALVQWTQIISSHYDWHVSARPATTPWMHLGALYESSSEDSNLPSLQSSSTELDEQHHKLFTTKPDIHGHQSTNTEDPESQSE